MSRGFRELNPDQQNPPDKEKKFYSISEIAIRITVLERPQKVGPEMKGELVFGYRYVTHW